MKRIFQPRRFSRPNSRNGIALIFVVGCLAMIVIAAISFASFMKVERLVSVQSMELAKGRQAALSGLERVVDRIARGSGGTDYLYVNAVGSTINTWPRTDVFFNTGTDTRFTGFPSGSMGQDGTMTFLAMDQLSSISTSTLYLPDIFTSAVIGAIQISGAAISIIANESGKIDVGKLQKVVPPDYARNIPGNVDLSVLLPAGGPSQDDLVNSRSNALDYFSLPEVRYSPPGSNDLTASTEPNFTFFEQAAQIYHSDTFNKYTNSVYVGPLLPKALLQDAGYKGNIADALLSAKVPNTAVLAATQNLIDFLDDDFFPSDGPENFCGEPIPLLNELVLTAKQIMTPSNQVTKVNLTAEFNFPFPRNSKMTSPATGANNHKYNLRITHFDTPGSTCTYTPSNVPVEPTATYWDFSNPADEYKVVVVFTDVEITSPLGSDVKLHLAFDVLDGGMVVDRVGNAANAIKFDTLVEGYHRSWEVRDGRYNFDPSKEWRPSTDPSGDSLGKMNTTMTSESAALAEYPYFVRNAPMQGSAELGHIALGDRPWQSIALIYDPDLGAAHRVLDTFTIHAGYQWDGTVVTASELSKTKGRAGELVRGLVNLNTDKEKVLQAALMNATRNARYPGDTSGVQKIVPAGAERIARNIIQCRKNLGGTRNSYLYKSEVAERFGGNTTPTSWQFDAGPAYQAFGSGSAWTENQYETFLGEFMDLCDMRGNTFVVLVRGYGVIDNVPYAGQHWTPSNPNGAKLSENDVLSSSVELVANVWHDPLTRRVQIRNIKWVDRDDDSIPSL